MVFQMLHSKNIATLLQRLSAVSHQLTPPFVSVFFFCSSPLEHGKWRNNKNNSFLVTKIVATKRCLPPPPPPRKPRKRTTRMPFRDADSAVVPMFGGELPQEQVHAAREISGAAPVRGSHALVAADVRGRPAARLHPATRTAVAKPFAA